MIKTKLVPITNKEMEAVDMSTADKDIKVKQLLWRHHNSLLDKDNWSTEELKEKLELMNHQISEVLILGEIRTKSE